LDHIPRKSAPSGVLLVAQELGQGGSERQLAVTAMGLRGGWFQPHVGTFRPGGFRLRELQEAGVASACFPLPSFTRPAAMARAGWGLRDYVRRNGIGIVHSYDAPGNVVAAPAAYGAARVITSQRAYRELAPGWMRPLLRMTDRLADRIVVNCRAIERHLVEQEGVRADKIRLCYNGIDVERFRPEGRERPAALREAELTVGVVCALRPEKDLGTLAEGFARAWRERPEMRLAVVGSGPEREPLERRLTELGVRGAAHLEPSTSDVAPWLRGIDIFVLPSKSEALSNSLMEAMACGCVAVASAVGGNPELVRKGETGLLFPAGDAEALAGCLLQLAREPEQRRRMAAQARRRMETEFTLPAAAKRMEEIYAEVLE